MHNVGSMVTCRRILSAKDAKDAKKNWGVAVGKLLARLNGGNR